MLLANFVLVTRDENIAGVIVPGRDAVPPPELPADAPILDIVHPVEIGLGPVSRDEADFSGFDGLDGRFRQRRDIDVPLVGQVGFDDRAAAIATR